MKRLLLSLFMTAVITTFVGISSYAETEPVINGFSSEVYTKDEAKFLTVKDEKGDQHLFKTIALLRFDKNGVKFEVGEGISREKTETMIDSPASNSTRTLN
ncbi:MAG TPA: hypothetical protein VNN20_16790 [Thermodesulfobacteriota bacterium]|nr:hypothetical protein [Thermodesulfobacteriota bacterium]